MTDQTRPLSEQQLDEYAQLIANTTPVGAAVASPGMAAALLAEARRLSAERDAFRDQRNAVFGTNRRLTVEVQEANQARLRAENEVRTALRAAAGGQPAAEGAQR